MCFTLNVFNGFAYVIIKLMYMFILNKMDFVKNAMEKNNRVLNKWENVFWFTKGFHEHQLRFPSDCSLPTYLPTYIQELFALERNITDRKTHRCQRYTTLTATVSRAKGSTRDDNSVNAGIGTTYRPNAQATTSIAKFCTA